MIRLPYILLLTCLFLFSCNKKESTNSGGVDLGLSYYPTDIGKYVIYDVDSIVFTDLSKDTLIYKYRIKEKFTETFTDNLGKPAIRLERFIKKYDANVSYDIMPWTIKEAWMVNCDQNSIQVVESNQRYTKLVFPIQEQASWNGNALNSQGERNYMYAYVDKAEKIGSTDLSKVLKVKQLEYRTLISYQNYVEKYAKGVGLVYREITDLQSNTIVSNVAVEDRIEQGIIYKQTLLSYGYE